MERREVSSFSQTLLQSGDVPDSEWEEEADWESGQRVSSSAPSFFKDTLHDVPAPLSSSAPPTPSGSQFSLSREQRMRMERRHQMATNRRNARISTQSVNEWQDKSAADILSDIGPTKSAKAYQKQWEDFEKFRNSSGEPTEDDFIRYLNYLRVGKKYQASTMWSSFSRLNNCYQVGNFGLQLV